MAGHRWPRACSRPAGCSTGGAVGPGPDAHRLAVTGVDCVVVDCESGPMRMGLAGTLATRLAAEHLALGAVDAAALHGLVRGHAA